MFSAVAGVGISDGLSPIAIKTGNPGVRGCGQDPSGRGRNRILIPYVPQGGPCSEGRLENSSAMWAVRSEAGPRLGVRLVIVHAGRRRSRGLAAG